MHVVLFVFMEGSFQEIMQLDSTKNAQTCNLKNHSLMKCLQEDIYQRKEMQCTGHYLQMIQRSSSGELQNTNC